MFNKRMDMYQIGKGILLIISIYLISIVSLFGQTKKIQIKNAKNEGIPFVNLYVINSNYGTISDVNGIANVYLEKINKSDTIRITCIGYEDRLMIADSLFIMEEGKIILYEASYMIDAIQVTAEKIKYKNRKTGVTTKLDLCQYGFQVSKEQAGAERGVIMKNDSDCYLESIHFNLVDASHDSMIYELNIYDYDNEIKSIRNTKRIFLEVNKSDLKSNSINIRDQNIKVSSDFFVSFEAVQVREDNWGLFFKAGCTQGKLCLTKNKNGKWIAEEEISPAIWCKMSCKK